MKKLSEPIPLEKLERNLNLIRERMASSADKAGRPQSDIRLVAVTKYVSLHEIEGLLRLGVRDFGESRVQDAEQKIQALAGSVSAELTWHLIGHLQTNKADKAIALFNRVHSVDSQRVAEALNKESGKLAAKSAGARSPLPCLLEVNVAGEANKFGLPPNADEIAALLSCCAKLSAVRIDGLMAMAPYSEYPEPSSRPVFRKLRELLEQLNSSGCYPCPLTELSMGMTQDFQIAIEEGATIVRVGSALFED